VHFSTTSGPPLLSILKIGCSSDFGAGDDCCLIGLEELDDTSSSSTPLSSLLFYSSKQLLSSSTGREPPLSPCSISGSSSSNSFFTTVCFGFIYLLRSLFMMSFILLRELRLPIMWVMKVFLCLVTLTYSSR
jgi:hypothetical protein